MYITITIPENDIKNIERLVDAKLYLSKSQAVRAYVQDGVRRDLQTFNHDLSPAEQQQKEGATPSGDFGLPDKQIPPEIHSTTTKRAAPTSIVD